MHRRALPLALAAGLALGLSACGSSNDDESEIARPPLRIISTVPVDGFSSPRTGSAAVEVNFNRPASRGELGASIFPPTSVGSFQAKSSSGMSWTWLNIDFRAEDGCYFWLIDGTELGFFYENVNNDYVFVREPQLVRLPSSFDRKSSVGFAGNVTSPAASVFATGTVVFALPLDSQFNYLQPATFDPAEAIGIAIAQRFDDLELPAFFTASMLPVDSGFIVVAVKDTSGDLLFSPVDDWWGAYLVAGEVAAVTAVENTGEKDSGYNAGVLINLQAPVGTGD